MEWGTFKNQLNSLDDNDFKEIELIKGIVVQRKKKSLSQRDLAELTGLKQSSIARIERDIVMPKLDTFIKIANALDLEITLTSKTSELHASEENTSQTTQKHITSGF